MATSSGTRSLVLPFLLIALLTLSHVAESFYVAPRDCQKRCTYRCSATSHKKPCIFYCIKCCSQCRCVPPGVYGNKQVCPCYNSWKTKEGRPKCP